MAQDLSHYWTSNKEFDAALLRIEHFGKNHPEMLPFIGKHYLKTRVLLIGESHYLSSVEKDNTVCEVLRNWYKKPSSELSFTVSNSFNTRKVVNNHLVGRYNLAMFRNPAAALIEALELQNVSEGEAFTAFSFYNYFQRPEVVAGKSFQATEIDEEIAYQTTRAIMKILAPRLVVFLSKKAHEAYSAYSKKSKEATDTRIEWVCHPTHSPWYSKSGKEKFVSILKESISFTDFYVHSCVRTDDILLKLTGLYPIIPPKKHRFIENSVTVRIYPNPDNTETAKEVVWHLAEKGNRYSIGYNVERGIIWIWDYRKNEYIEEENLNSIPNLHSLYKEVSEIILLF